MEACNKRSGPSSVCHGVAPAAVKRIVLAVVLVGLTAAARHRTANFIVDAPDPNYAAQVAQAAENYRRQLGIEWLGKELPNWSQPCPITVNVGANLGAGGATTFVFDRGEVYGWRMTIQGPPDRLIDSVLPHEITHMIFASHFRRPLPRWADEGAATTVEHPSERNKYYLMLHQFLRSGQGISFSQMFAMKDYPRNPMPLYAQSYSLAEYLIQLGGRRKYVEFVGDGLQSGDWAGAVGRNYGVSDLGQLQNTWLAWVRQGSPPLRARNVAPEAASSEPLLAAAGQSRAAVQGGFNSRTARAPRSGPADQHLAWGQTTAAAAPQRSSQPQPNGQSSRIAAAGEAAGRDAGSLAATWQPAVRTIASDARNAAAGNGAHNGSAIRPDANLLASNAGQYPKAVPLGRLVPVARLPEESGAAAQPAENPARPAQVPGDAVAVSLPPLGEPPSASPAGWWSAGGTGAPPSAALRSGAAVGAAGSATVPDLSSSQLGRPQTPQGPRHIIIQWGTR